MLWRLCFVSVISLAVQTLKLLKLLQSWSLTLFLANYFQGHHQSGHLCAWQAFPRVYFTGGPREVDSSSNLRFVIMSITCNNSMYQWSDRSFTDRSVHFFVLRASFLIEMLLLLYWDDREQFSAAYTAVGQVDRFCHLHLCMELNKAGFECSWTFVDCLVVGMLGLLKPPSIYYTLFWGQCDFNGGRVKKITKLHCIPVN